MSTGVFFFTMLFYPGDMNLVSLDQHHQARDRDIKIEEQDTTEGSRIKNLIVRPRVSQRASPALVTRFLSGNADMHGGAVQTQVAFRLRRGTQAKSISISDYIMNGSTYLFRAYNWNDNFEHLAIKRIEAASNGPGFLTVRGNFSSLHIENVIVESIKPNSDSSKVPAGIALAGKSPTDIGNNTLIKNVYIKGIRSSLDEGNFDNGDAVSVERGYRNVRIENTYGGWSSDAGFDIKSPTATLNNVISERNRRNFKFWSSQNHGRLVSINPGGEGSGAPAHIQLQGSKVELRHLHIKHLTIRSDNKAPIFEVENGKWLITIDDCSIKVPDGTAGIVGNAELSPSNRCNL